MPEEYPEALRLFVACPMPDDVKRGVVAIQDDLRGLGVGRLRWVRPEGMHITLKFLGSVPASQVDDITRALKGVVIEPFELRLTLDGLGGFGGTRLRVVWVGLGGDVRGLAGLAGQVEGALGPLGFPPERRPFAPHVTLARVPERAPSEKGRRVARLVEAYTFPSFPPMIVTEVHLMRSILGPGGSVYERVAAFPAGGEKGA